MKNPIIHTSDAKGKMICICNYTGMAAVYRLTFAERSLTVNFRDGGVNYIVSHKLFVYDCNEMSVNHNPNSEFVKLEFSNGRQGKQYYFQLCPSKKAMVSTLSLGTLTN